MGVSIAVEQPCQFVQPEHEVLLLSLRPGQTVLTRMLYGPSSAAADWVNPLTANLEAQ